MAKRIVVVGATGIQASSVVETFLHLPNWKVRGLTRNPFDTAARALANKGAEIVKGDLDDISTLYAAFAGAHVIFSNTDYFAHLSSALASKTVGGRRTPAQYAFDREVQQGVNVAKAAASPAVLNTLERFVYSSLSDARKWSCGKYASIAHFQSKAEVERLIRTHLPEVATKMSTVQLGYYHTNWKSFPAHAPKKQPNGTFEIQRTFGPEYINPFIHAQRDTGAFVKALVDLPAGTNLLGASESMTWPDYARLWGEIHGVKAVYRQVSEDEHFKAVPEDLRKDLAADFRYIEEFGRSGGDPSVHTIGEVGSKSEHEGIADQIQLGVHVPTTSVREYIESEDWSAVF